MRAPKVLALGLINCHIYKQFSYINFAQNEFFDLQTTQNRFLFIMIKKSDLRSIRKDLQNLNPDKAHKLLLLHLSAFSDFFLNIASYGDEAEKTLGLRVGAQTLAPLSFIIINTIIYTYENKDAPYHKEIVDLNLPINDFKNHPLIKFDFTSNSEKFSRNTLECIAHNINYPKETVRRQLKPWIKIDGVLKDKKIGYYAPFEIIFETNLFKKTHFWIAEKMAKNWSDLLKGLSDLKYLDKTYSIDINIKKADKNEYFRIWVMLHWYWSLCFRYIQNSPLNYNECCVLSSSLYFNDGFMKKISHEILDFYAEKIIRPVNLNSIAESTLIPRESVRRIVNSLINKNILKKIKNKIYVSEFVTDPKFLATSNDKSLQNMINDTLVIIENMFSIK